MPRRPKTPPPKAGKAAGSAHPSRIDPPATKAANAGEGRWQRTVRYCWDKGGARGGRK